MHEVEALCQKIDMLGMLCVDIPVYKERAFPFSGKALLAGAEGFEVSVMQKLE